MEELSLEEKVGLLTGADAFTLPALPRIGLRGLRTSDGPAGVRGTRMDPQDRSTSFPAPIAPGGAEAGPRECACMSLVALVERAGS